MNMRKSKFTGQQINGFLKQAEAGIVMLPSRLNQPMSGLANRMQNTYEATFFDKEFCLAKSSDASFLVFLTSAHGAQP
jgi:hypothetical protein